MERPLILIDSSSSRIRYNGTLWQQVPADNTTNALGGSLHVCDIEGEAQENAQLILGDLTTRGFKVYGTVGKGAEFVTIIDTEEYHDRPVEGDPNDVINKQGIKIFEASVVPGPYTLHISPKKGLIKVDYILSQPTDKTRLANEDLIFDDTNPSFNYTGAWSRLGSSDEPLDLPELPFNGTLMSATQPGTAVSFPFTGSSISVFGAFNVLSGAVTAEFRIDEGEAKPLVLLNRTVADQDVEGWTLHEQYFQFNVTENPQDEHTLHVTVKDASVSQPFFIDYVIVRGNEHSRLAEKNLNKSGSALKNSGMTIGISFLAIIVVILLATTWRLYRKRQKAKASLAPPNSMKA